MPTVKNMWVAKLNEVDVNSNDSWIAIDSRCVPDLISDLNNSIPKIHRPGRRLQTFDFKKMYTNIRLPELKSRLRLLLARLFNFERSIHQSHRFLKIYCKNKKFDWSNQLSNDSKQIKVFTA